jgi:hypothetical protein
VAILQVLIALALRSLGRIANTALGWATVLLFGRIPQQRQIIVTTMAFGSVVWLVAIAGIVWPEFGTFLLTFVTLPPWVNYAGIRLAMLAGAAAIPLVVGAAALLLVDPPYRPRGAANIARALLPGYRFTFGMAVTLIITALIAPVMRARTLLRRRTTRHLPVVIHTERYDTVVRELERMLAGADVGTRQVPTSPLISVPTRMLVLLMGGTVAGMATHELATLAGRDVEIIVHPFDIIISGRAQRVTAVQALLTEMLPFTPAYLTWTRDANEIEDRLREVWRDQTAAQGGGHAAAADAAAALDAIEHTIRHTGVAFEEWEVLFREFLLVERRLRPAALRSAGRDVKKVG